jgi:hypothetical protein
MTFTIQAHDLLISGLAILCVMMLGFTGTALVVRVLGRKWPDILEAVAAWALVEAAGWRARDARKAELAGSQPRLELRAAAVEGGE